MNKKRILIINQNVRLTDLLEDFLENEKYKYEVLNNFSEKEFLNKILKNNYICIFICIEIKDETEIEFINLIRKLSKNTSLLLYIEANENVEIDNIESIEHLIFNCENKTSVKYQIQFILKKIQNQLYDHDRIFKIITENSKDVIWILNENLEFIYVSPSVMELRGYSSDEVMKQSLEEVLTEESYNMIINQITQLKIKIENNEEYKDKDTFILEQPCKNGKTVWTEVVANFIKNENDEFKGIIGITRDITNKKYIENTYKQLLDTAIQGIIIISKQSKDILYSNNKIQLLTFLSSNDEIIDFFEREIFLDDINKASSNPIEKKILDIKIDDNNNKWLEISCYPVNFNNEAAYYCSINDITLQNTLHQELSFVNEQLLIKNKELEEFVYVTSHDLRSPLLNIQGFIEEINLCIDDIKDLLDSNDINDEIRNKISSIFDIDIFESMGYINRSIIKMDSLITGLIKVARTVKDKIKIEKIDMNILIKNVISNYEFKIKDKNIDIEISEIPMVKGDYSLMNQLFSNLIENAIRYMDKNRKGLIKIYGYEENNRSIYCIEDNGIGINEKNLFRVFDLFQRVNPTSIEGEGIGLSIVKRIINKHHGNIWVESEPNKGSKFYISLPNLVFLEN